MTNDKTTGTGWHKKLGNSNMRVVLLPNLIPHDWFSQFLATLEIVSGLRHQLKKSQMMDSQLRSERPFSTKLQAKLPNKADLVQQDLLD